MDLKLEPQPGGEQMDLLNPKDKKDIKGCLGGCGGCLMVAIIACLLIWGFVWLISPSESEQAKIDTREAAEQKAEKLVEKKREARERKEATVTDEKLIGTWSTIGMLHNGTIVTFGKVLQMGFTGDLPAYVFEFDPSHSGMMRELAYNPQMNALASTGNIEQFIWSLDVKEQRLTCGNHIYAARFYRHYLMLRFDSVSDESILERR